MAVHAIKRSRNPFVCGGPSWKFLLISMACFVILTLVPKGVVVMSLLPPTSKGGPSLSWPEGTVLRSQVPSWAGRPPPGSRV